MGNAGQFRQLFALLLRLTLPVLFARTGVRLSRTIGLVNSLRCRYCWD